jgi:valyl-tRNA synthetase
VHEPALARLGRVASIAASDTVPSSSAQFVVGEATWALPLAEIIDIGAEKARLEKELKKLEGEIAGLTKKLGNEQFLAKAPDEVVAEQRARLAEAQDRAERIKAAISRLN